MDLVASARLPFPRAQVFACYRDKMAELLPYLANVRKIDVTSRTVDGPVVRLINIWHGGGEIPAAARAVLSDNMLSWTDTAVWNEAEYTCEWSIKTHAFAEAVTCGGLNRFYDEGSETRIEMKGNLRIDAKQIRGIPGFLAGSVGRTIEEFLASRIQPNFVAVTDAISRHLAEQKG